MHIYCLQHSCMNTESYSLSIIRKGPRLKDGKNNGLIVPETCNKVRSGEQRWLSDSFTELMYIDLG